MSTSRIDPAKAIASSLDNQPEISARNVVEKLLLRWRFFAFCVIAVPVLALAVAHLVPPVYKASSQILIRHQGGPSSLYGEFAPAIIPMSGASASELMRSNPIVAEMVQSVGVRNDDIAQPAYKVALGKIASAIVGFFYRISEDDAAAADPKLKASVLANDLKTSIDVTTLMVDRGTSANRDEVLQITIKSTNREKVAAMANGVCDEFIRDYNHRSRVQTLAARDMLVEQARLLSASLSKVRDGQALGDHPNLAWSDVANAKPLASSLAKTVSDLELQLVQLQSTFSKDAPQVVQLAAELSRMQTLLAGQEAADAAKEQLALINRKLRQVMLAEKLYETDQGNLTVVERAITPKKSKVAAVLRYAIPGVAGLVAGVVIGVIGIVMLNLLDPRIFAATDASSVSGLPLLGLVRGKSLPNPALTEITSLPVEGARAALFQVLSRLDLISREKSHVLVVTSPENESATASISCQLAALQARDRDSRVLLIDANFETPLFDKVADAVTGPGLLDVLGGSTGDYAKAIRPTKLPRLFHIVTGSVQTRDEMGATRERWKGLLDHARSQFAAVIVHAPGLLNSREGAIIAKASDRVVIVTARGASTKGALSESVSLLTGAGVSVIGVIHGGRQPKG